MMDIKLPAQNRRILLTLGISAAGILFFLLQAFSLGAFWLNLLIDADTPISQTVSIGLLVWSSIFSGLMLVPIFLISYFRMRGESLPVWLDTSRLIVRKVALWLILPWPLIVLLGWFIAGNPQAATFLLGPINLLVAGIPILWIYTSAHWKLEGGPQLRKWRIFGFSLTVMPVLVIIIEVIALFFLAVLGVLWFAYRFSVNPQLESEFTYLFNRIAISGRDPDAILQILEPYFLQPSVIFLGIAIFGGIMPIIEELFKPLALWTLAGRKITAQEGFVGGLLCGAGFALMENVLYFTVATTSQDWLFMAIGRASTGILHMLASGLVGWGLAKAWHSGKWRFLGLTTLGAFLFHGIWNSMALISGIAPFLLEHETMSLEKTFLFNFPTILLLIVAVAGMYLINRYFRRKNNHGEGKPDAA